MKRNIERIINELMADDRIQRMHRDNIAKRLAAEAAAAYEKAMAAMAA